MPGVDQLPVPSANDLEWLRLAAASAGEADRPRAAGLLGLGLAAYVDTVGDTAAELPGLLDEADTALADARRDPATGLYGLRLALAAGTVRWRRATLPGLPDPDRALLDAVIADLTSALGRPWTRPLLAGDLTAAQWDLATALTCRHRVAGRSEDALAATAYSMEALAATPPGQTGSHPAAVRARATMWRLTRASAVNPTRFSPAEWATAAPRLRELLETTPREHEVRPLLRLASAADVLTDALRTERWPDGAEIVLAQLRGTRPLWGVESSMTEHQVARRLALALGCVRMFIALRHGTDANGPVSPDERTELDDLRAELDALSCETVAETVRAGTGSMLAMARATVACGLAMRVARAQAADEPYDPADLDAIEGYLRDGGDDIPPEMRALVDLYRSGVLEDPDAVPPAYEALLDAAPEQADAMGGRIVKARSAAVAAARNPSGPAVSAAVDALQSVLRSLPIAHPARPDLLALTANLLSVRATLTSSPADAVAALDATVTAAETVALLGRDRREEIVDALAASLLGQVGHDVSTGPFARAQRAIEAALAEQLPVDPCRRYRWTVGLATALALQWSTVDDDTKARTRRLFADAERLLRGLPTDRTFIPHAMMAFLSLTMLGTARGDAASVAIAARMLDLMDERLAAAPHIAVEMSAVLPADTPFPAGMPTGADGIRAMLAQLRTGFATLRSAPAMPAGPGPAEVRLRVRAALRSAADAVRLPAAAERTVPVLTALLADGLPGPEEREQVHAALGRCLAAAAGLSTSDGRTGSGGDVDVRTAARLVEAIRHLEAATVHRADPLPTPERADLLDLLARCQRAASVAVADGGPDQQLTVDRDELRRRALDSTRAALRELFGAVQLDRTGALAAADRANHIALRAVHWCLADGDAGMAVSTAEAGRSLVLSSIVLSGRTRQYLADHDRADLADGWAASDETAMLAALGELTTSVEGTAIVAPPQAEVVAGWVNGAGLDAAVYLAPPAGAGTTGTLLVVGRDREVRLVPAPELVIGAGSPVARYQEAFIAALEATETGIAFRATPEGLAWAAALDELGHWTYRAVVAPLLSHTRQWAVGREARLGLIPLGALGAIPYAAAWTEDTDLSGGRRYAIHDLVLTQAASARVLFDAARRPRMTVPGLARDRTNDGPVVLATDPTRELPLARRAATVIAGLYPEVVAYSPAGDRGGPTAADVLAALPGAEHGGAALLHLATHGRAGAVPADSTLVLADRPIRLAEVLDQARSRAADAPGGTVICDACLTDATHAQHDESLTLSTAFLSAGATAVIGTRWPTDDDTAAAFALKLHREFAAGHRPGPALRRAQLAMLDQDDPQPAGTPRLLRMPRYPGCWAEPATWAGYVHHGV